MNSFKKALIGSQGTVGHSLLDQIKFDAVFNSDNIQDLKNQQFDVVYIAAPSGNRLAVNRNQGHDEQDFFEIQSALQSADVCRVVLLSTVDAVVAAHSRYGRNRANMETWLKNNYSDYYIVRLSTLIGAHIKKNVLFDLKHQIYLDQIDFTATIQWCLLDTLAEQIDLAMANNQREINLVSQPIANWQLAREFFSDIPVTPGSSTVYYDQKPYYYTAKQIFSAIRQYLK